MNYELNDEQLRIIANTAQVYEALLETQRDLERLPEYMTWKNIKGSEYLYVKLSSSSHAKSNGVRSPETEKIYNEFFNEKDFLQERGKSLSTKLHQHLCLYKALNLPTIMALPARILRNLDLKNELGTNFIVVGTNAFIAYEIEARERFASNLDETDDFDLSWCRGSKIAFVSSLQDPVKGSPLFDTISKIDSSFRINKARPYQAINNDGYEVELLTAPSVMSTLSKDEVFSTAAIPEQEWLLLGKPIRHIICAKDGTPAPLFVPDPRYMALHKMWLSEKDSRNPAKKNKDFKQGDLLLDVVVKKMTASHPVDINFVLGLPDELLEIFNKWAARHKYIPGQQNEYNWFK